jgi:hypothetical protein
MAKNVDYDTINIDVVQGDTLDMTFTVWNNNALYDMTGMQMDIEIKDDDDELVASLTTEGASPSITVSTYTFRMYMEDFILTTGTYYYDIQLTNGTKVSTICRGKMRVIKQYTD